MREKGGREEGGGKREEGGGERRGREEGGWRRFNLLEDKPCAVNTEKRGNKGIRDTAGSHARSGASIIPDIQI